MKRNILMNVARAATFTLKFIAKSIGEDENNPTDEAKPLLKALSIIEETLENFDETLL